MVFGDVAFLACGANMDRVHVLIDFTTIRRGRRARFRVFGKRVPPFGSYPLDWRVWVPLILFPRLFLGDRVPLWFQISQWDLWYLIRQNKLTKALTEHYI